jgi:hypothetical protein
MTEDRLSAMPKHAKNLKSIHDKGSFGRSAVLADHKVWTHTLNLH